MKIIETNLSLDNEDVIKDFQSRIIEVDSWGNYVEEIMNAKCITRNSFLGSLHGFTIPLNAKVESLKYDEYHLSCNIINAFGVKTKKLAYIIK